MGTFKDIAEPLAKLGVPTTPVRPGTKRAFLPDFPTTATTDLAQIETWDKLYPDCNGACVARAEVGGVWFFEVDSKDVIPRMERETGQTAPNTFRVRSRPGRGHYYFRHTAASMAMGNISQTYVIGQDWSVRTNREYVVGPGSIHPDTQQPYLALSWDTPIIEAPEWLVTWLLSQKIQKQDTNYAAANAADAIRNAQNKVPHGAIHGFMLTHAGRMRNAGLTQEEIEVALLRIVNEQCEHPIDESKVVQMSRSICNFPSGQQQGHTITLSQPSQPSQPAANEVAEDAPQLELIEYPLFPRHVMFDTSIYNGFVKPYCEMNERIDYFMWMPAAAMMMNYLGTKVSVPFSSWKPSFFIVLIGKAARTHKSSCIKDALEYFKYASTLAMYSKNIKNADSKSVVWEAGSPEGLGTDMMRINCKNAILVYDELSGLVGKARIDCSGMATALLKLYDSNNFSNSIKAKKDTFSVDPGSYCATLITSTTDRKFTELWSQLAGEDTGLNDRFTWVLEPKVLPEKKLEHMVNYNDAALVTRRVMDVAVQKSKFEFFDKTPLQRTLLKYGPRQVARAEKWALYFAIDLGLDEIDEDCVARGIELVAYEEAVKDYLLTFEAKNDESAIQQGTVRLLKKNHGLLEKREIVRALNANKYGGTVWDRAYNWLVNSGHVVEYGKGIKGDPRMVKLLRDMSFGRDDD
jgi:hypothetical protein